MLTKSTHKLVLGERSSPNSIHITHSCDENRKDRTIESITVHLTDYSLKINFISTLVSEEDITKTSQQINAEDLGNLY